MDWTDTVTLDGVDQALSLGRQFKPPPEARGRPKDWTSIVTLHDVDQALSAGRRVEVSPPPPPKKKGQEQYLRQKQNLEWKQTLKQKKSPMLDSFNELSGSLDTLDLTLDAARHGVLQVKKQENPWWTRRNEFMKLHMKPGLIPWLSLRPLSHEKLPGLAFIPALGQFQATPTSGGIGSLPWVPLIAPGNYPFARIKAVMQVAAETGVRLARLRYRGGATRAEMMEECSNGAIKLLRGLHKGHAPDHPPVLWRRGFGPRSIGTTGQGTLFAHNRFAGEQDELSPSTRVRLAADNAQIMFEMLNRQDDEEVKGMRLGAIFIHVDAEMGDVINGPPLTAGGDGAPSENVLALVMANFGAWIRTAWDTDRGVEMRVINTGATKPVRPQRVWPKDDRCLPVVVAFREAYVWLSWRGDPVPEEPLVVQWAGTWVPPPLPFHNRDRWFRGKRPTLNELEQLAPFSHVPLPAFFRIDQRLRLKSAEKGPDEDVTPILEKTVQAEEEAPKRRLEAVRPLEVRETMQDPVLLVAALKRAKEGEVDEVPVPPPRKVEMAPPERPKEGEVDALPVPPPRKAEMTPPNRANKVDAKETPVKPMKAPKKASKTGKKKAKTGGKPSIFKKSMKDEVANIPERIKSAKVEGDTTPLRMGAVKPLERGPEKAVKEPVEDQRRIPLVARIRPEETATPETDLGQPSVGTWSASKVERRPRPKRTVKVDPDAEPRPFEGVQGTGFRIRQVGS